MEESIETLTRKKIRRHNLNIITDIILYIILGLIFLYAYWNIDLFKTLNEDVCRLCEHKTGGNCISGNEYNNFQIDLENKNEEKYKEVYSGVDKLYDILN